jgi:enoyl-CoA hydratase/carnithine racemase
MSQDILVEQRDGIATVTFNRPEQRNAINYSMWLDLQRISVDLETANDVRVVVFRGAGDEAFSAGADIKDFDLYRNNSAKARVYASAVEGAMDAVEGLSKPTLCLIKGYCVGGGFELTHACDIRIASDTAKVGITAARLGICIGYREMRRLVQTAGRSVAMDILLTGRLVDAREALHLGLVSQVADSAQVDEHTYDTAARIARLAPLSHKAHKEVMSTVLENPGLKTLTPAQEALPFAHFDSKDFLEGRAAFLEKRRAEFRGE